MADKFCIPLAQTADVNPIAAMSCHDALAAIPGGVMLFTPALFVTHAGFDRDPVQEFDSLFPADKPAHRPFIVESRHEKGGFFSGLGTTQWPDAKKPVHWDYRLYAIAKSRQQECLAFFSGIYWIDKKTMFAASAFNYAIDIPDPTSKRQPPARLTVTVFGVAANKFVAYLEEQLLGPARARKSPPQPVPAYLITKKATLGFIPNPENLIT